MNNTETIMGIAFLVVLPIIGIAYLAHLLGSLP